MILFMLPSTFPEFLLTFQLRHRRLELDLASRLSHTISSMHIHLPGLTSVFVWWPFVFVRYGGFVLLIFFGMNVLISFAITVYFPCTHSSIPSLRYYEAWKGSKQEAYVSYGLALVAGLLSWKMYVLWIMMQLMDTDMNID